MDSLVAVIQSDLAMARVWGPLLRQTFALARECFGQEADLLLLEKNLAERLHCWHDWKHCFRRVSYDFLLLVAQCSVVPMAYSVDDAATVVEQRCHCHRLNRLARFAFVCLEPWLMDKEKSGAQRAE